MGADFQVSRVFFLELFLFYISLTLINPFTVAMTYTRRRRRFRTLKHSGLIIKRWLTSTFLESWSGEGLRWKKELRWEERRSHAAFSVTSLVIFIRSSNREVLFYSLFYKVVQLCTRLLGGNKYYIKLITLVSHHRESSTSGFNERENNSRQDVVRMNCVHEMRFQIIKKLKGSLLF